MSAATRREGREGTVAEFGDRLPATVSLDEDLRTAVSMMFMYDVPWLTCVDSDGLFAGVVTQRGITRLLGETYRDALEAGRPEQPCAQRGPAGR